MDYKKEVTELFSKRMRVIDINNNEITLQAKFGPSKYVRIPLQINEELSCLTAIIIGDGHLRKAKFNITIGMCNIKVLNIITKIIFNLFNINTKVMPIKQREGKSPESYVAIYSKAVHELMNLIFKIPRGKKCYLVRMPPQIFNGKDNIKVAFIIGLLIAEGSKKDKVRIRITNASKNLILDIRKLLQNIGIESKIESWVNKKYKREYYAISFKRIYLDSLMRGCRSGQTGQILSIFKRIIGDHA